jgi:hypothetical protein
MLNRYLSKGKWCRGFFKFSAGGIWRMSSSYQGLQYSGCATATTQTQCFTVMSSVPSVPLEL